jgi:maltooligosyltrehalose trehalohydrolase
LEESQSAQTRRQAIEETIACQESRCQALGQKSWATIPEPRRQYARRSQEETKQKGEEGLTELVGIAGFPRCFGPQVTPHGFVFNLWAPTAQSVELLETGRSPRRMHADTEGWYQALSASAHLGTRYQFRINEELIIPDPASRFQPDDVGAPSEVFEPLLTLDGSHWKGRPWQESIIYELHVGAFSKNGTYEEVENKLEYLKNLGVTAIELMPLNDVPGRRNWGYDGVLLFAPNACYGRPEDLKRLIKAAHALELMVYLDVVYNHFGPHLNYLHSYAEPFFNSRHQTGWGPAVNLEGKEGAFVRQFLIENALMWIGEYGFDGLRLDAVHALKDKSEKHFLTEVAETVRCRFSDRHVHLMLENEANQASLLQREDGKVLLYDAQWGDDFHNALHVLLTGEKEGYYRAFADQPLNHLGRALAEGFAYQGEIFPLHDKARGERSAHLPPEATIFFAQNHDQIGNRALGERLPSLVDRNKLEQAIVLLLLNPHIPLLFMGEEAAQTTPFLFFTDWTGDVAKLTREGRRKEFAHFKAFSSPEGQARIPDPSAEKTFLDSKIDWRAMTTAKAGRFCRLTHNLLALRCKKIVPFIKDGITRAEYQLSVDAGGTGMIDVCWHSVKGATLQITANFSQQAFLRRNSVAGELLWPKHTEVSASVPPGGIFVWLRHPAASL